MTKYVRKPTTVEVFRWERQPQEDWPVWLTTYRGRDSLGQHTQIATSGVGTLLVPVEGVVKQVSPGDYVVFEGAVDSLTDRSPFLRGAVSVHSAESFANHFEAAPE